MKRRFLISLITLFAFMAGLTWLTTRVYDVDTPEPAPVDAGVRTSPAPPERPPERPVEPEEPEPAGVEKTPEQPAEIDLRSLEDLALTVEFQRTMRLVGEAHGLMGTDPDGALQKLEEALRGLPPGYDEVRAFVERLRREIKSGRWKPPRRKGGTSR